jgi:Fe-S-cluster-containing hydrogenase component 2
MPKTRKIIEIDEKLCNGCGQCVPSCAEGAIQIIDGKARLVAEKYCDGLGACLGDCPTGALTVVEREADEFDEAAVEEHLKANAAPVPAAPSGCPSAQMKSFSQGGAPAGCPSAQLKSLSPGTPPAAPCAAPATSALGHWPVQIRLVPPSAPFLQGADLLVAADCVPVACGTFHQDFLQGRVVMVGCPKFDDMALYEQRFTDIFAANDVKSVTIMVMEVPCCQSLPVVVRRAIAIAGKAVPTEIVRVSLQGEILDRTAV